MEVLTKPGPECVLKGGEGTRGLSEDILTKIKCT